MAKRRKGLFAALLSVVMLFVSLMTALLPALAAAPTKVTEAAIQDQGQYGLTEVLLRTDAAFTKAYNDLQSSENATGEPSQVLMDAVMQHILIDGKTLTELMDGMQWYNGVRVHIATYGDKQQFDLYLYDAAIGGHLYDRNFTVELTAGLTDSEGNAVEPMKLYYDAATHTFGTTPPAPSVPPTKVTEAAIQDQGQYGLTEVLLRTDAAFTKAYNDLQSSENATGEPSQVLMDAVMQHILIDGKTLTELMDGMQWYNGVRVHIATYGDKQQFDLYLYDAAIGGHLYDRNFTVELTAGLTDSEGNAVEPMKLYYDAATHTFGTTPPAPPVEPKDTSVSLYMEQAEAKGGFYFSFETDSDYDDGKGAYQDLLYGGNTTDCWRERIDTPAFRQSIERLLTVRIGSETHTLAEWTEAAGKKLFAVQFGTINKKVCLFLYYWGEGDYAPENTDLTFIFAKGFALPDGEALPDEATFTRKKHAPGEGYPPSWWMAGADKVQEPLSEVHVTMDQEVAEARGGWYFAFDTTADYDDGKGAYQDLVYTSNTTDCWRERIDTEYFRNSIMRYLTVTIGERTMTLPEWNAAYQAETGNGNLFGVLFGLIEGKTSVFLYYWGKDAYLPTKNVITVNFMKGFCLPDGEGLTDTASFTRSKHKVESAKAPEWWSDDGSTKDYDNGDEITRDNIVRDDPGDRPVEVAFSTETKEGTGMIYFDILTAASFGQDDNNVFNGLQYADNDTVWRPAIDTDAFKNSILHKLTIRVGDEEHDIEGWQKRWHLCLFRDSGNYWRLTFHYNAEDKDTFAWWNDDVKVAFLEGFTLPTGDVIDPIEFTRKGGVGPAENGSERAWSVTGGQQGPESILGQISAADLSPAKGATAISLPQRDGYRFEIVRSKRPNIVTLGGKVTPPAEDTYVTLTVEVTRLSDGVTATGRFSVLVPGVGGQNGSDGSDASDPAKPGDPSDDAPVTGVHPAALAVLPIAALAAAALIVLRRRRIVR